MSNKYVAIIPVRAGSRRLPNKNILPFGDSNLLIHKIRQLKKVKKIDEIVVSSDSEHMLAMAIQEGVSIHKRPVEYADDKSVPFGKVVAYCANATDAENIIWAPCTCPLCDEFRFIEAINEYEEKVLQKKVYDSVISTKLFKEFLWDQNKPLNYKLGSGHILSQNLPDWQVVVNGFFIASRENMISWEYFFGINPFRLILSKKEAVDIDDGFDYAVAKALYNDNTEY